MVTTSTSEYVKLFPINQFPQRVGTFLPSTKTGKTKKFPINQFPQRVGTLRILPRSWLNIMVSNQLVSLASRDSAKRVKPNSPCYSSFQSISFPSEQGRFIVMKTGSWQHERFQSISFPSEQGHLQRHATHNQHLRVSNQLVSLASRDRTRAR